MPYLRDELRHITISARPSEIGMYGALSRTACTAHADMASKTPMTPHVCAWGASRPAPPRGSGSGSGCLLLSSSGPRAQGCSGCLNVLSHTFLHQGCRQSRQTVCSDVAVQRHVCKPTVHWASETHHAVLHRTGALLIVQVPGG